MKKYYGAFIPLLAAALFFTGFAVFRWHIAFDDAFISYRYARHLAEGAGICWNIGEAPVEGYTNFLLVVLLAPLIKLGFDPLTMTRIFSYMAVAWMCVAIFSRVKKTFNGSGPEALVLVGIFLLSTRSALLCTVGLETVLFGCLLLYTHFRYADFFSSGRFSDGAIAGFLAFLSLLLRPEAVVLPVAAVAAGIAAQGAAVSGKKSAGSLLTGAIVAFVVPCCIYLIWKYSYFHALLPNPYYLKAASKNLISPLGLHSVAAFISGHVVLIGFAAASFFGRSFFRNPDRLTALAFAGVMVFFFLHVDTLMDVGNRFLYPASLFVFYLAIPAVLSLLRRVAANRPVVQGLCALAFVNILTCRDIVLIDGLSFYRRVVNHEPREPEMSRAIIGISKKLGEFGGERPISIALGDAGVIPYYSRLPTLDHVGLNDRFIARQTDPEKATDYIFSREPDLFFLCAGRDNRWLTSGHGRFGDNAGFTSDRRWENYTYAGTVLLEMSDYDYHLFIRNACERSGELRNYLSTHIIDGRYEKFPLPLGGYSPGPEAIGWIPVKKPLPPPRGNRKHA